MDTGSIGSEVKFEAAAPVGDKPAHDGAEKFPHIYGPIRPSEVSKVFPVVRKPDGTFVRIEGLTQ